MASESNRAAFGEERASRPEGGEACVAELGTPHLGGAPRGARDHDPFVLPA